jgi:hypothetical protein
MLNEEIYKWCKEFIQRDEFKKEIKEIIRPFISLLFQELYPYIYMSAIFVFISFILLLAIFVLLWRSQTPVKHVG